MFFSLLLASGALAAPGPGLWFTAADRSALQARCAGPEAELWRRLVTEADQLCDPQSSQFADPARLDAGGSERVVIRAHTWGRRLTEQVETLGFVYQLTGDPRYGRAGAAVLVAAAEKLPVEREEVVKSFAGARGDIARGLAVGLDWLDEALTPTERARVVACAAGYVTNILAEARSGRAWWVPHHNFIGVAVGAAGCLALLLRHEVPEAVGQVTACTDLLRLWLDQGFDEEGAYVEGLAYANYGLSNGLLFLEALRRAGGENLFGHPRLRRVPEWFAMSLLPGEKVGEDRNDSGLVGASEAMLLLAERLPSGLARWLWDQTGGGRSVFRVIWSNEVKPVDPVAAGLPLGRHFVGRGLAIFRTGWERDDLLFSLECGPFYPVTHNQRDKGHFNFYGRGGRWCIDAGYGNDQDPAGRASSLAHSVILIDDRQQALAGAGRGTSGSLAAFADDPRAGYVLADAAEAYRTNNAREAGPPVERALRHAFFVRPADGLPGYVVILDDIRLDANEHRFTWQWRTDGSNDLTLLPDGARARPAGIGGEGYVTTPVGGVGRGSLSVTLPTPRAGRYKLWARVRAGGEVPASSDSFLVQVAGGAVTQWHMPSSPTWTWGSVGEGIGREQTANVYDLPAGEVEVVWHTRETGAEIDRLAFLPADQPGPPLDPTLFVEAEAGQVTAPMEVVRVEREPTATLRLWLSATTPVTLTAGGFLDQLRVTADAQATEPRFAAIFAPLPEGLAEPRVTRAGETLTIAWPTRTDRFHWPADPTRRPRFE